MPRNYYQLAKPGMIYGNAVVMAGGFLLASHGRIDAPLFAAALAGQSLVIASGCVFNNYIDRDIDALMARTHDRPSVSGAVSERATIIYGSILGCAGGIMLFVFANMLAFLVALFGFVAYVFLYTLWSKRTTVHGTAVGALAGATPPVIGYAAASGRIDLVATMLFLILMIWQIPHFYAIGIRRLEDYRSAGIAIMPVVYGVRITKILMCVYIACFTAASLVFAFVGRIGLAYAIIMGVLSMIWLLRALQGLGRSDDKVWAAVMFALSLVIIMSFSVLIAVRGML